MTQYRAIVQIEAEQWTGYNLDEMKALLSPHVDGDDEGPYVYSEEIEPYFLVSRGYSPGYNILKFYVTDDHEVDPGQWVVIYNDGEVEIMDEETFQKMGFVKK